MHRGLQFRIGYYRQIDQALDRAPIEGLPNRLVFGLYPFPSRACRDVDTKQTEAFERDGHGLRVLRLHGMEQDLQVVGCRLVDFRLPSLLQLPNQSLGCVEVTGQKLTFRAFEPQPEH